MTPLFRKFLGINWVIVANIIVLITFGIYAIYNAADGRKGFEGMWSKQVVLAAVGLIVLIGVALVDYKWLRWIAWPMYFAALAGVVLVKFIGTTRGVGAVEKLVTIAPALGKNFGSVRDISIPSCPWMVVQGDADEVIDGALVIDWAAQLDPAPRLEVLSGVGHFFHGHLPALQAVAIGIGLALATLFVLQAGWVLVRTEPGPALQFDASTRTMAGILFSARFVYVFEATSVLILAALVGAVALARKEP